MTSRLKKYLFTLAIPLTAVAIASLWLPEAMKTANGGLVYETADVTRGLIRRTVSTSGPVRAMVTVQVGSQLSGQIQLVSADYNTEVTEGDILAKLDAKTYKARVDQARADLASARAQLSNSRATEVKAEAVLKHAQLAIERQAKLAERGIAAHAAVETATKDAEVARAEISVAQAQIESAEAVITQRQAQLDQAQIDLDRTIIRSPINGTVISRTVDVGQTVAASLQAPELFQIAQDLRRIRIEAQVNEADVGVIQQGNPVSFTVDAYPERRFTGRVTQVRLAATELNSVVTYTVIVEASNEDRRLFPGMTANVQIVTAEKENVLRLSNDAMRFRPRDRTASGAGTASAASGERGQRGGRIVDQLKSELKLTDEQAAIVGEELTKMMARARANTAEKSAAPAGFAAPKREESDRSRRGQFMARIEQIVTSILTPDQVPLFDLWKRERESARNATVWVLASNNQIEDRFVRLGVGDDQFTEVLGGNLKPGDRLVTRAREVRK